MAFISSSARRYLCSPLTLPSFTTRYGVMRKPYSSMSAVDGQRGDEADVGAFRRFDRADSAVVRNVHVAHFEAGALAVQAAGTQGPRDAARA